MQPPSIIMGEDREGVGGRGRGLLAKNGQGVGVRWGGDKNLNLGRGVLEKNKREKGLREWRKQLGGARGLTPG